MGFNILKKINAETIITALSVSFLLSLTLCFFGPATLYYSNVFEYTYTFSEIFPYLIGLSLIFGLLLAFVFFLLNGKIHQKIICFFFALGLSFYIQGNILVWDYGLLDGHEIIWNNYLLLGVIDSLVWIAIIILSILKSDKIYKFIPVACLFLLVIQTGGLLALVYSAPDEPQWKSYSFIDDGSKFEFSENTNVIIILIDTFESDVFWEIINENDDYKKMFSGFTYYRNTIGGYPNTRPSIPLILTGKYYNNSVSFEKFIQTSYKNSSIPKTLKENGYIVGIYSTPNVVYADDDIASNVRKNSFNYQNVVPQLTPIAEVTLFRHIPHFLKQAIYPLIIEKSIDQGTTPQADYPDLRFNDQLNKRIRINDTPTFKFYYLWGSHPPFHVNENLEYEELPNNRSGFKEASKASLKIVGNLLEKLKEKKIFDRSIIVVVGDHGRPNTEYGINMSQMQTDDGKSYVSQTIVTAGIPLLLFKPLNSTHDLAVSDVPVSSSDIPKSVASELDISNNFTGESIMSVRNSDKRNFSFYDYAWTRESGTSDYLPPLHEFTINNFSWYASSWQPTFRVYYPDGVIKSTLPYYNLGTTINFRKNEESQEYLSSGWSTPEKRFVWSNGKDATIAFSMNPSNSSLMNLQITASPYIVEHKHELQRVSVSLNRHKLGDYSFTQPQSQNMIFSIPSIYLNEQVQYLTFHFPDAISPSALGISNDPRNLAIALSSFNITEMKSHEIEYTNGWYSPEISTGIPLRWMGSNASLTIYSDQNRISLLNMQLHSFNKLRTLEIFVEGERNHLEALSLDPKKGFIKITSPVDLHKGKNTIWFNVSEGCEKPSDIPALNSSDCRCLSLLLKNLTIE